MNTNLIKSEVGLFLRLCFELPFLSPNLMNDVFVYDIKSIAPTECEQFTDYLLENYISGDAQFPPSL